MSSRGVQGKPDERYRSEGFYPDHASRCGANGCLVVWGSKSHTLARAGSTTGRGRTGLSRLCAIFAHAPCHSYARIHTPSNACRPTQISTHTHDCSSHLYACPCSHPNTSVYSEAAAYNTYPNSDHCAYLYTFSHFYPDSHIYPDSHFHLDSHTDIFACSAEFHGRFHRGSGSES